MADGARQAGFGFRASPGSLLRAGEIVVDLFAGGGGASEALRQALGRDPDICINHDEWAIGMHAANHPLARHLCEDVWHADPRRECASRRVGWLHASPDCTHFSQAKGGQPRSRATRSLSWVVLKWAGAVRPRIISLENVEQILKWGPLVAKRDRETGRVLRLDGTIASRGERVPIEEQFLIPDKRREGRTWGHFVASLRGLGYAVEWRKVKACDHGAGTSRTRLFMVARCDGEAIRWPEPTHGPGRAQPYVTAANCIDWSTECPSIFTRKKPLADATLRRIARGIHRYVLTASEPFIAPRCDTMPSGGNSAGEHHGEAKRTRAEKRRRGVLRDGLQGTEDVQPTAGWIRRREGRDVPSNRGEGREYSPCEAGSFRGRELHLHSDPREQIAPLLTEFANASRGATWPADEPLRTQCAQVKGGHFALAAATLVQASHGEGKGPTKRRGSGAHDVEQPLGTVHAGGGSFALATAILAGVGGRAGDTEPRPVDQPGYTITAKADCALVTAYLEQAAGGPNSNSSRPRDMREPVSTIVGKGSQQQLVTAHMAKLRGTSHCADVADPLHTISAGGEHHAVVECTLSPEAEAGALRVAAFLVNYYGNGQPLDCRDPLDTVTTRDRLALVTVTIKGTPYVIVDIGLRMLRPPELYRAQGFPPDYIIDRTADGRAITRTRAVRMVGNSVSPPPLCAIARANLDPAIAEARAA